MANKKCIIYINLKELTSHRLHFKFQSNRPSGSGEDFISSLPNDMAAILFMCPEQNI